MATAAVACSLRLGRSPTNGRNGTIARPTRSNPQHPARRHQYRELRHRMNPFVRIQQGTLVRTAAVARVEALKSGDFTVDLACGAELRGSRRSRAALETALQAR